MGMWIAEPTPLNSTTEGTRSRTSAGVRPRARSPSSTLRRPDNACMSAELTPSIVGWPSAYTAP